VFKVRKATDGTISFYKYYPCGDNPKHFTHALELSSVGVLTSYFSDPYERVTHKVTNDQVRYIFEWMARHYYDH
jgi:hypothetical protein